MQLPFPTRSRASGLNLRTRVAFRIVKVGLPGPRVLRYIAPT